VLLPRREEPLCDHFCRLSTAWTAYNKIKHHRHKEFPRANLHNALNAVATLFVVVLYQYADKARTGHLGPAPQLLRVDDAHFGGITHMGHEFALVYAV
jgi:hypothetical protein